MGDSRDGRIVWYNRDVIRLVGLGLLAFGASLAGRAGTTDVIRSAAELQAALRAGDESRPFVITATVTAAKSKIDPAFYTCDASGGIKVSDQTRNKPPLRVGDVVALRGGIRLQTSYSPFAYATNIVVAGHVQPPEPVAVTAPQLLRGEWQDRLVRFEGTVIDAFQDEIDPQFSFVVLQQGRDTLFANFYTEGRDLGLTDLIDARISLVGCCHFAHDRRVRSKSGLELTACDPASIKVLKPAPVDRFAVPPLHADLSAVRPPSDDEAPTRRLVRGHVLATWHGNTLLVKTPAGEISKVELTDPALPDYGDFIEAVGRPETDLYHYNLSRAIWRPALGPAFTNPPPQDVTAEEMLTDGKGARRVRAVCHGLPIRMTGFLRSLPAVGNGDLRTRLECGDYQIPVDFSAAPDVLAELTPDCRVAVAGTCVMELENCRPQAPFPHIEEFTVVVRTPDDVRILSRPSWWTPGRLLAALGCLAVLLVALLLWNAVLRLVVERRSRQLFKAQIARAESELRIGERTRLAVELHDSLAQNLTGVSLEIDTAAKVAGENPADMMKHLVHAGQSLKSCRDELRNCLWDLRNLALEEKRVDDAIRQTLAPHVAGVDLAVRFNVPRERLSDNTAHAILRIIRELTLNAIRHGRATRIRVAGSVEGDKLLFSIRDNGCGFDPATAPGFAEGHCGLLGIRERIDEFEGEFKLESEPGKGTKATVVLQMPKMRNEGRRHG